MAISLLNLILSKTFVEELKLFADKSSSDNKVDLYYVIIIALITK